MVPTPIDDEIISIIQSQIDNEGFVSIGEQFKAGDKVVIQNGTFKNFTGVFEREYKDSERVKILLTTVNYQSHLMIERDSIKKLA
jgi:transcription antitermination factor NusG